MDTLQLQSAVAKPLPQDFTKEDLLGHNSN